MSKPIKSKNFLSRHIRKKDRILLVNPPVVETRYSWIRWNQPLDLLKLGAHLRSDIGCAVELFDFMKPNGDGDVPETFEPLDRRYRPRDGQRYPMRHFGRAYDEFRESVYTRRAASEPALPTQVWISSLCWYWFGSVSEMCRLVREILPDALIVLIGNYPFLKPDHAEKKCDADFAITDRPTVREQPAAFDLYGTNLPPFLALRLQSPKIAIKEIEWGLSNRITKYTLFEEDILFDEGDALEELTTSAIDLDKRIRFHVICGLHPERVTTRAAKLLASRCLTELHFEEADLRGALDVDLYREARGRLVDVGIESADDRLSGFVWIGRPKDELESLVERSFQVLDVFGNLILKPYSPVPGSAEHEEYRSHLDLLPLADWSPHFFPFAEVNGISCGEYHDLYRMAAFLNEKVRSRSFDFLQGTLGVELLRKSLEREAWNLAPSPLRVIG